MSQEGIVLPDQLPDGGRPVRVPLPTPANPQPPQPSHREEPKPVRPGDLPAKEKR